MARLPGSVSIGPRDTEILFTQRPPLFWESSVTRTVYDSVERSASFLFNNDIQTRDCLATPTQCRRHVWLY